MVFRLSLFLWLVAPSRKLWPHCVTTAAHCDCYGSAWSYSFWM